MSTPEVLIIDQPRVIHCTAACKGRQHLAQDAERKTTLSLTLTTPLQIRSGSNAPSWRAASVAAQVRDQTMPAVDAEVVLIAKGRDREIDARCPVLARVGLGMGM